MMAGSISPWTSTFGAHGIDESSEVAITRQIPSRSRVGVPDGIILVSTQLGAVLRVDAIAVQVPTLARNLRVFAARRDEIERLFP